MKHFALTPFRQQGSMLLEALIAILIFSVGVIAMIGLQAASVKLSSDAKYRSDASMLANQVIGQMWVSNRTPAALQTNFQGGGGTNGSAYTAWASGVAAALPGVAGIPANQPTISVSAVIPTAPATNSSSLVTIRLFWKSPSESGSTTTMCNGVTNPSAAHCYIATAQIL